MTLANIMVQVYTLAPLSPGDPPIIIEDWTIPLDSIDIGHVVPTYPGSVLVFPIPHMNAA